MFDGDAMSAIVPRSSRTMNEIAELSSPKERFIAYKNAKTMVGEAQDSLIGTAELTRTVTTLNKEHAMKLFSNINVFHDFSQYQPDHVFTGRDIISILLCETGNLINFNKTSKYYDQSQAPYRQYNPADIKVEIDRGKLKTGILDKASIGQGAAGGIFHIVHNRYGAARALELSYYIQQIALEYLFNRGVTVSIRDLLIKPESLQEIHDIESALIAESMQITDNLNHGKIIAPLGKTIQEYYEALQREALSPGDSFWPPILRSIDPETNNFDKLIFYGSKGDKFNFKNISSALGQLDINGERMAENYGRRTIAYFTRYDPDPCSRGYIPDSYMSGIGVPQLTLHSWETRYQLINKALSTSITGMYNRMAIKNLESLVVDNFRRVNKSGRIIQLLYGGDGVDPRYLESVPVPTAKASLTLDEFEANYHTKTKSADIQPLLDEEYNQLIEDRKFYVKMFLDQEAMSGRIYQESVNIPVNVRRIIDDTLYNLGLKKSNNTPAMDLKSAVLRVKDLCDNLSYSLSNEIQENMKEPLPKHVAKATTLIQIVIRSYLNTSNMLRMKVSDDALDIILREIKLVLIRSLISYGTVVGILAAQSISEPLTQMVLDSHHFSGASSTKKKGMMRVREILNASPTSNMKSPSMIINVLPEHRNNKALVQEIANNIECLNIGQFVSGWKIFYEKYGKPEHPLYVHEQSWIKEFEKYNPNITVPSNLLRWCIRLEMSKNMLIEKHISMENIYSAVRKNFPFTFVIYTTDNSENMIMRIYMEYSDYIAKKTDVTIDHVRELLTGNSGILQTVIRGINGIKAAYVKETISNSVQPDNSIKTEKIYYIFTDGTNLKGVVMNPMVDRTTIRSDSIMEMTEHYGIEAGRLKIIHELGDQIDKSDVSHRHFTIYADEMTYTGMPTSIDRYGSAKRDSSIMLRISDASPLSVIEESAINASFDSLSGVSPPIMVGRNPYVGDLYNTFKLDEKFISTQISNVDTLLDDL